MNEYQIKRIPKLVNEENRGPQEIADMLQIPLPTVNYWIRRLRKDGVVLKIKKGRPYRKFKL